MRINTDHLRQVLAAGIPVEVAGVVTMQVEALYEAGIGRTFEDSIQSWKRINAPKDMMDRAIRREE